MLLFPLLPLSPSSTLPLVLSCSCLTLWALKAVAWLIARTAVKALQGLGELDVSVVL